MHDATHATTPAPPTSGSRAATPSSAGRAASPSAAVKVQLRAADYTSGQALLTPRPIAPVQKRAAAAGAVVQREAVADAGECSDTPVATNDEIGVDPVDGGGSAEGEPGTTSLSEDLGAMSSFAAVLHKLGMVLDPLAPAVGSSVALSAKASVTASGVYGSLGFSCSLARSAAGLAGTITLSGSVGVGSQAGTSQAYAALKLSSSLSVKGDSGGECADLAGLWAHTYLSSQPDSAWEYLTNPQMAAARVTGLSKLAADALWGEGFPAAVLAQMDPLSSGAEADTVSQTAGIGIEAAAKDTNPATAAGASGEVAGKSTTTLGKDDTGKLTKTNTLSAGMTVGISALGCSGSITVDSVTGWRGAVTVPIPAQLVGPGEAIVVAFASVIDTALSQLVAGKALDPFTADNALATLTSWHGPVTSGLEEAGLAKGSVEFAVAGTWKNEVSLTVTKIASAALPVESLGGGAAGVGLEAKAESKAVIISLP